MARVVILKTGNTYPSIRETFGDFDSWFVARLAGELNLQVVDVTADVLPGKPTDWDGVVVTGSPAMVSEREPWSERTGEWLAAAVQAEIPVLGVCYGHQLLAHALGGEAGYNPRGRETGTHEVELLDAALDDPLFKGFPSRFPAQLTHRQSALKLPHNAVLLARNEYEPHQAFRVGPCAWGVQFHPEFSAEIMRAYLKVQAPDLRKEGLDAETLLAGVQNAPEASSLLDRFSRLVLNS